MNVDRKKIFQLIYENDWTELIRIIHEQGEIINKFGDEITINAIQTFIKQFINESEKKNTKDCIDQLHMIFSLHKTNIFRLSEKDFKAIVLQLVDYYRNDLNMAKDYAYLFPNDEICADIIKNYNKNLPQTINHSQSRTINVTAKTDISELDSTISLFKSSQEEDFFTALCQIFVRQDVYPNVAISCLIKYQAIQHKLSMQEKDFFFKGIIDCVVFNRKTYKPIYFFELDSKYHDLKEQKIKDSYKDKILNAAGQKLYRIRKKESDVGVKEFEHLINELLDDL